jgi:hypothetical protein
VERIEWALVDKSGWPDGPWQHEPDKIQWQHEGNGLPCMIIRHPRRGHLNGYVAVPPGHPWHGRNAESVPPVATHWEISYAAAPETGPVESAIAHEPGAGEPADVWWFGFHCAHDGDMVPADPLSSFGEDAEYRDVEYVAMMCAILAGQLAYIQKRHDEIVANAAFVCARCGKPSNSPADAEDGYCGECHARTGEGRANAPAHNPR